jgi:hypothetical protein
MKAQWWLTVAYRPGLCSDCGAYHRKGAPILFRASTRQVLCQECAGRRGIFAEPSASYRARFPVNDERPETTGRSQHTFHEPSGASTTQATRRLHEA